MCTTGTLLTAGNPCPAQETPAYQEAIHTSNDTLPQLATDPYVHPKPMHWWHQSLLVVLSPTHQQESHQQTGRNLATGVKKRDKHCCQPADTYTAASVVLLTGVIDAHPPSTGPRCKQRCSLCHCVLLSSGLPSVRNQPQVVGLLIPLYSTPTHGCMLAISHKGVSPCCLCLPRAAIAVVAPAKSQLAATPLGVRPSVRATTRPAFTGGGSR